MSARTLDGAARPRPIPKCACGHYQIEHAAPTSAGGCRVGDHFGRPGDKCPCDQYRAVADRPAVADCGECRWCAMPAVAKSYQGAYCADHFDGPQTKGMVTP